MFKQNRNFFFVFLAGFLLLNCQVSIASSPDANQVDAIQVNDDAIDSYYSPVEATFTGEVNFEPRYTRVNNTGCADQACQKSQKYWSLVIVSRGHRYILNKEFNLGVDFPPDAVVLNGSVLMAGTIVKVDGQVIASCVGSSFLVNIDNLQVVSGR